MPRGLTKVIGNWTANEKSQSLLNQRVPRGVVENANIRYTNKSLNRF